MPLTPNFTCSSILGSPSTIVFEDTSTGSNVAIVARRITLQNYLSANIVPSGTTTSYIDWALATNPLTVNILLTDYALSVRVDWIDVSGTVVNIKTIPYVFQRYNVEFNYSLTYSEANGNASLNSSNWLRGRMALYQSIQDADNAITEASSITDSQAAIDRGTAIRLNPNVLY